MNEQTEKMLGVGRKLLQRIVEFDSFETCYPNDKDRAKANVSDIQKIVKLKDTVTKYENYLSREQSEKIQEKQKDFYSIRRLREKILGYYNVGIDLCNDEFCGNTILCSMYIPINTLGNKDIGPWIRDISIVA